ncbi:hypothetical protein [Paraburkholderia sp. CI3]|uniref:hypothetical protein n=1 Tax=Paraburkholderia sp. CI3 TaxID=2991060 RepID=UPI003D21FEE3
MSRIHVSIDRLVLSGMDPAARTAFVDGLKSQLTEMLAQREGREAWARNHRTPVLKLGQMAQTPGISGARRLGNQVARGIGKGLKP